MSLRLKEKHEFWCKKYKFPCKCIKHKFFTTKKEIDSFIQLDSKTLNFILSKYTNWNILGKTDKNGNKIRYKRHSYLSKMCNLAINIKCMRSLSYYKSCYFQYDPPKIDIYYDLNYSYFGYNKDHYKTDKEFIKDYNLNMENYKNGVKI